MILVKHWQYIPTEFPKLISNTWNTVVICGSLRKNIYQPCFWPHRPRCWRLASIFSVAVFHAQLIWERYFPWFVDEIKHSGKQQCEHQRIVTYPIKSTQKIKVKLDFQVSEEIPHFFSYIYRIQNEYKNVSNCLIPRIFRQVFKTNNNN